MSMRESAFLLAFFDEATICQPFSVFEPANSVCEIFVLAPGTGILGVSPKRLSQRGVTGDALGIDWTGREANRIIPARMIR